MSVTVVAAAATHIRRLSSSSAENSSNKQVTVVDDDPKILHSPKNKWAPFESKEEFNLDVTLLLIFIVCFVLGAFLLNYLINRFVNIGFGGRTTADDHNDRDNIIKNKEINKASGPTLEFSKGIKMAGTEAVCAICLSEFVEGEKIRVLPKCNHGFHFNCIEKWLLNFKTSCPTCRTDCLNSFYLTLLPPPTTTTAVFIDEDVVDVESGVAAEAELAIIRTSDHHHHEEGGGTTTTTTTESGSSSAAAAAAE